MSKTSMGSHSRGLRRRCGAFAAATLIAGPACASDDGGLLDLINAYRSEPRTCEGRRTEAAGPLAPARALVDAQVAADRPLLDALKAQGYQAAQAHAIAVSGPGDAQAVMALLQKRYCRPVLSPKADFLGGHVPLMVDSVTAALPHVRSGKAVPLAVTSATRATQLPGVPAVRETGIPGVQDFEAVGWLGLMAPRGTPAAVVDRLNREVVDILRSETIARFIRDKGSEPAPTTPREFDRFVASEIVKWAKVVKASGATAD